MYVPMREAEDLIRLMECLNLGFAKAADTDPFTTAMSVFLVHVSSKDPDNAAHYVLGMSDVIFDFTFQLLGCNKARLLVQIEKERKFRDTCKRKADLYALLDLLAGRLRWEVYPSALAAAEKAFALNYKDADAKMHLVAAVDEAQKAFRLHQGSDFAALGGQELCGLALAAGLSLNNLAELLAKGLDALDRESTKVDTKPAKDMLAWLGYSSALSRKHDVVEIT